ncbi:MAG: glycosyltransferase family 4 protein [Deltaproteobacteria bacterium]|nr:glycosyltransferase family 4 protein [Deltaproteobacteria bacterium]
MNLLHICDHFYPDRAGGSEIVIYETARRLAKKGHRVSVVTLKSRESLAAEEEIEGMRVYRYTVKDLSNAASSIPFSVRGLFKKVLNDRRPDVVHFHHTPSALGVNMGLVPGGVKRVYSYYGPINEEFEIERRNKNSKLSLSDRFKSRCYLLAERYNLKKCDRIVALSRYSIKQISELHGKDTAEKAVLIPGGIDTERFRYADEDVRAELRKRFGFPDDAVIVLTVRRLVKRMGIDMLIEAFAGAARSNRTLYLVIGGIGPEKDALVGLTATLGVRDRVSFRGFIPAESLVNHYQAADLCVLPTRDLEGFGLVTLEAMSTGTPVIGTAVGATVEVLGGFDEDLLIREISPAGIREKLEKVLYDTGYLKRVRPLCRDYVLKNYSWDSAVESLERVYEDS